MKRRSTVNRKMKIDEWCSKWSKTFDSGVVNNAQISILKKDIENSLRQWSELKKVYRKKKADNWRKNWNDRNDQKAPYIDDQVVSFLQPTEKDRNHNRGVLQHLTPAAFVAGRESEAEARARTGKWIDLVKSDSAGGEVNIRKELPRYILELKQGPGQSINWKRLFFVSAGGIGKSTTLSWLEAEINELPDDGNAPLAFNLRPEVWGELNGKKFNDFKVKLWDILAMEFFQVVFDISERESLPGPIRALGNPVVGLFVEPLLKELQDNKAVILIDGLDHHHSEVSEGLACLQKKENKSEEWPPIVLSGRAYVLKGWAPRRCDEGEHKLRADLWTFCTLSEFDEAQQKRYLGQDRFDCIHQDLKGLLAVPRFLRYVRDEEDKNKLKAIRTPADLFFNATHQIISAILAKLDEHKINCLGGPNDQNGIVYAKALLGAIAFEMLASTTETQDGFASWEIKNSNMAKVKERLSAASVRFKVECLTDAIKTVSAFGNVRSGIIDSQSSDRVLIWDNKDVQSFFIAYWLANFYHRNPQDEEHLKKWIFSHVAGDEYYEINRFLADFQMQEQANPLSWVSSVSVWFEPSLMNRPSEMMYRSWSKLTRLAGEPPCDWWNTPYSKLDACGVQQEQNGNGAGCNSANSLTDQRKDKDAQARTKAGDTLKKFRGELQGFLSGKSDSEKKKIAEEFINMEWRAIPEATDFEMGPGKGKPQGFSEKSKAYWKERCEKLGALVRQEFDVNNISKRGDLNTDIKLTIVKNASKKFSEEFNEQKWFDGALGGLIRKKDVEWFAGVVEPIAEKAIDMKFSTKPETTLKKELSDVELQVLEAIGEYWKRKDETPLENPQKIVAFELQSVPVRHSWFNLFSPGHYENVNHYLKGKDSKYVKKETDLAERAVIFVSWFDAWAFCQWACWTDKHGNHYRCRLPHEPEWEFAARRNSGGNKVTSTKYWWGDQFYTNEKDDSTTVDPNFENHAHAEGEPGETLDANAKNIIANGFGLKHMLGNVWELMANVYTERDVPENPYGYSRDDPNDPESVPINQPRSMRGGLWYFNDLMTFCTNRFRLPPGDRDYKMGFRLVRYTCKDTASPQEDGVQEAKGSASIIVPI